MKRRLALAAIAPLCLSCAFAAEPAVQPAAAPQAIAPATAPAAPAAATASPAVAPAVAVPAVCCKAMAGTMIDIELAETVTSKFAKRGDKFSIRLVRPIVVDGAVIVPAGVMGVGEVIDAAHGGFMGKPGELLLAARYLDYNGQHIPLRAFKVGGRGNDNTNMSLAVSIAIGLPGVLVKGGDLVVSEGAQANAKLAADLVLPAVPPASAAPAAAPPAAAPPEAAPKTTTNP